MNDLVYKQSSGLTAALAPSQLELLKMSWKTSLRKSGGGTLERSFAGYLGVPTLMDVDGLLGYDLCGQLSIDINTLQITQEITRLPLAPSALPVDVAGVLTSLAGVSLGYRTPASVAPIGFKTVLGLGTNGALLAFDNTVTGPGPGIVQRIGIADALNVDFSWTGGSSTRRCAAGAHRAGARAAPRAGTRRC